MTDDRALELWGRFLSGETLAESEREELLARLEADAEFRQLALTDFETHGLLRSSDRVQRSAEGFARLVGRYVAKEREATGFAKKVQSRIGEARGPRPRTRRWRPAVGERSRGLPWGFALAAGAVAVALVFLAVAAPSPGGRREEEVARRRKPVESPAEVESRVGQVRQERERLEQALAEREEERRRLSEAQKTATDERSRAELKERERELERVAAGYRARVEAAREKEREAAATAAPPAPVPEQPAETRPAKPGTEAAVAKVARAEGEAYLLVRGEKARASPGREIPAGAAVETRGPDSYLEITFADRTRLEIGADAEVRDIHEAGGKRLFVARGHLRAEVAKQPKDLPMVFLSPHSESTVLGTTLRLAVEARTQLDVEEGKVRLKRLADGKTVEVVSGHSVTAAVGLPLIARLLVEDEIVISARRGKNVGPDWKPVADDLASTEFAWEAGSTTYPMSGSPGAWIYPTLKGRPSYVEFQFFAAANKSYHVWVRGRATAVEIRGGKDEVALATSDGSFEPRCIYLGRHGADGFVFTGFSTHPAYGWIGGAQEGKGALSQAVVRFSRTGLQTLRLYAVECPMRVDAIWLSATQKTTPNPDLRKR